MFKEDGNVIHFSAPKGMLESALAAVRRLLPRLVRCRAG